MKGKIGRHLFHLVGGCIPPIVGLVLPREWTLVFFGTVAAIFVAIEILRLTIVSVNRWLMSLFSGVSAGFKPREVARPIGTTFYLVASFLTFLFFSRDVAVAALFFAAVGDAMAAAVGEQYGRTKVGMKSLEGSGAFFASALVVGFILVLAGLHLNWLAVTVGAAVAALVELLPIPIDDNLTVPIISAVVMTLLL
ncbi:MAG: hypothetical protein M1343_09235 [Chloroflexi bacterium]|nr:hypothetical protein [Chloroflexota bacterium]MDA8189860.1 hypothetical protein [Dehalococcoidales bacterium]